MSAGELWVLGAVSVNGSVISGCTDHSFDPGIRDQDFQVDGLVDPTAIACFEGKPQESFSTIDVARAFTVLGIGGFSSAADFYLRSVVDRGLRDAGSVHLKISQYQGLFIPTEISASQGQAAKVSYTTYGRFNGTNAPFSLAANQAMPAVTNPAMFTLGPVGINGAALAGISSVRIATGFDMFSVSADGDVWPSFVAIKGRRPVITIRTTTASVAATLGTVGTAINGSKCYVWLRQVAADGTIYSNASSAHIRFEMAAGKINVRRLQASGNDPADCEIEIRTRLGSQDMIIATLNQPIV